MKAKLYDLDENAEDAPRFVVDAYDHNLVVARLAEAEAREQMLLRRCDELEADRDRSDTKLAEAEALLREARAAMWSVARYVDLIPDGRAEAFDEVRALSRRIDAHFTPADQPPACAIPGSTVGHLLGEDGKCEKCGHWFHPARTSKSSEAVK